MKLTNLFKKFFCYLTYLVLTLVTILILLLVAFSLFALYRESQDTGVLPSEGQLVDTGHGKMFVISSGDQDGQPIILVHGMAAWSGTWRNVMNSLVEEGYFVVAVDMPPFGFSDRYAGLVFDRISQAQRIKSVIDYFELDEVIVVGHSFGGRTAVETTLQYPETVSSLVLVAPALDQIKNKPTKPHWLVVGLLGLSPVRYSLVATTITNPQMTETLIKSFLYKKETVTKEIRDLYLMPLSRKGNTSGMGEWLVNFVTKSEDGLSTESVNYQNLPKKLFLIWGDKDTVTPIGDAELIASLAPQAKIVVLQGIGHIPQIEDPESFTKSLLEVLQEAVR